MTSTLRKTYFLCFVWDFLFGYMHELIYLPESNSSKRLSLDFLSRSFDWRSDLHAFNSFKKRGKTVMTISDSRKTATAVWVVTFLNLHSVQCIRLHVNTYSLVPGDCGPDSGPPARRSLGILQTQKEIGKHDYLLYILYRATSQFQIHAGRLQQSTEHFFPYTITANIWRCLKKFVTAKIIKISVLPQKSWVSLETEVINASTHK